MNWRSVSSDGVPTLQAQSPGFIQPQSYKKKKKGKTGRRVPPPKTSHYVYANISKPEKISEILLVPSISDKGCTHCTLIYFRMG
jgi:hypothetical protein